MDAKSDGRGTAARANEPVYEWPRPPGEPAREVWYALVTARERPLALWVRYTLCSTVDGEQTARLWGAVTDREGAADVSLRTVAVDLADVEIETPFRLALGDRGHVGTDGVVGALPAAGETSVETTSAGESEPSSPDRDLSWDLSYTPDTAPFTPLRSSWLTTAAVQLLGTGRHWSANQTVAASGTVTVDGEPITFEDAPAHQGHTVGTDIATSWQWVHCNSFAEEIVFEALRTRGRTSICLRRDGNRHRLNRLHHVVGPFANETTDLGPAEWYLRGSGDGIELAAVVEADPDHWRLASYRSPDGSLRYVAHCSLSRLELSYRTDGTDWHTVESDRARAEWADTDPPVEGAYPPFDV